MIASLTEFERFGHLAYYPLAGGDKASKEAVRPIVGLLGFASQLRVIWQAARLSDPYAEWWLVKVDQALSQATDALLVVEVSDTTLEFDRTVKLPRYAAAGVPETSSSCAPTCWQPLSRDNARMSARDIRAR